MRPLVAVPLDLPLELVDEPVERCLVGLGVLASDDVRALRVDDGLRDVMIRGFSITNPSVAANIVVLLAFATVFSVLGLRTLENNGA